MPNSRFLKRLAVALSLCALIATAALTPLSSAGLQDQISAKQSLASSLQAQINADSAAIARTGGGLAAARAHLAQIQAQLAGRIDQLRAVQTQLMAARDRLAFLESRLRLASTDLAANLRSQYEQGAPNLVSVILTANGFTNLLQQVNFAQRISRQDAQIVGYTRTARRDVLAETVRLGNLEERDRALTNDILAQRNQVAALESALLSEQIRELQARSNVRAKLAGVDAQLSGLRNRLAQIEARAAAEAAQTGTQVNAQVGGIPINTGGMVQPPPGAPAAVREMIAAGNAIATLPYIWGGGHGSFIAPGYDCSGSVSYVLAAAGLLSAPEVSGDFESYGDPGPGAWVTIYANAGHVWMTIAGWRFDTVALAEFGTRWSRGGGEFAGFVERHPPGL
jgi:cell wall-associated NlpC family hydrolase